MPLMEFDDDDLRKAVAHVLYVQGKPGGFRPGSFHLQLLETWMRADMDNFRRLAAAFPVYGLALAIYKDGIHDMEDLVLPDSDIRKAFMDHTYHFYGPASCPNCEHKKTFVDLLSEHITNGMNESPEDSFFDGVAGILSLTVTCNAYYDSYDTDYDLTYDGHLIGSFDSIEDIALRLQKFLESALTEKKESFITESMEEND